MEVRSPPTPICSVYVNRRPPQHSPVTRLPLELVMFIFESFFYMATHDERSRVPWRLCSVCYFWKEIVIRTPILWTFIDFNSISRNALHIRNAAAYPIHIHLRRSDVIHYMKPVIYQAIQHRRNIESLHLEFVNDDNVGILLQNLYTNLPTLRKLCLSAEDPTHYYDLPFVELSTPLSRNLRYVSLCQVFFRRLSGPTNIRVLEIYRTDAETWDEEGHMTMDEVIDILAMCPHLEELSLQGLDDIFPCYPSDEDIPLPIRDALLLENLRSLKLQMIQSRLVSQILAHIIIPSEAQVTCEADSDLLEDNFDTMLPPPIPHRQQGPMILPELHSAMLSSEWGSRYRIEYFRDREAHDFEPSLSLQCWWGRVTDLDFTQVEKAYEVLLSLPSTIPVAQLTDIHIWFDEKDLRSFTNEHWRAIFSGFVAVTTLCLGGSITTDDKWLHAFGVQSLSDGNLVLPNLTEICLLDAFVDGEVSQLMKKVLSERSLNLGRPLHFLWIDALTGGRRVSSSVWPGPAIDVAEVEDFTYNFDPESKFSICGCKWRRK